MITRNFTLYLNAGHAVPLVINVNQYDVGEQWVFSLINGNGVKYTPSTGAIVGIKSDGLGIINSGSVNADGDVVINETKQMTAAVGKNTYELLIDDQTHGTANFIVLVEPKPGDQADFSESDLSLLQQAIDGTSATAIAQGVSDWMDDNLTPTTPVVDQSLTVSGAAADSAVVGQEIGDLKSHIASSVSIGASGNDVNLIYNNGASSVTVPSKTTVGNLSDLQTTDKSNLVSAINEAAESGGDSYMYVEGTTLYMGDNMTESLSITQNGSYNVKKYATANVNVPSSGITPTGTKSITANGTYDVTNFASAEVAVPTGGSTPTGTKQISITQNGTTTEDVSAYANAEITVNVPTGEGIDPLQYARSLRGFLSIGYSTTYTFPFDTITINAPLVKDITDFFSTGAFSSASQKARGLKKVVLNIETLSGVSCFNGATDLEEVEINASNSANFVQSGTSQNGVFTWLPKLKKITGIVFSGNSARWGNATATNPIWLPTGSSLEEVRFVAKSMTKDITYHLEAHSKLSNESLVSIANAMADNTVKHLGLHATPVAKLATIMGTVTDDTFTLDANGTVTLQDFITNTKGWTVG